MTLKQSWKTFRDLAVAGATFWKESASNQGIKLSLQGASPRVRFSLLTGYEVDDARLCRKYLKAGDKVVELGSSVGFIALYCIKNLGITDFAMIEANPALHPIMLKNFALNAATLPTYLNVAGGAEDGEVTFNVSVDYYASSLNAITNTETALTVRQLSLPSIIAEIGFKPNVLIMDIEGAETQIPIAHLALFDTIIVEFHRRFVGDAAIDAIIAGLVAHGFKLMENDGFSSAFVKQ
ncbi:MAG: FkbM family methyltransferase [Burkholderiaceae bacterium]